jgi:peptide/nickel transport system substrate-binding protein
MHSTYRRSASPLALAVLAVLLGLAGCHGRSSEELSRSTAVVATAADLGGVNELTLTATAATDEILFRLFLHLVEEQPDYQKHAPTFVPRLAESWEWSADHKVLTFRLREAVWSDGVPITAEDVRWSWQAQIHPAVGWTSSFMKRSITDVEVIDPRTIRFHFNQTNAKQMLDANEGVILPKHVWSQLPFDQWRTRSDWFRDHLVTSGPFLLDSWTPQQEVVLKRNPRYYVPGLPRLERVVVRIIPDQGNQVTQLLSGQVDFVPSLLPGDAERVRKSPILNLVPIWFRSYVAIVWNNAKPLFADRDVRRALTLAIDRQALIDTLWGPYARASYSPIVQDAWAYNSKLHPWPYDPEEARRILAAKGWKDTDGDGWLDRGGKPFAFELTTNAGNQPRVDALVMIQEQLKRIGVRAQPKILEFHTLVQENDRGTYDGTLTGISMDTSLDLRYGYHSASIQTGDNFSRYSNPEIDRLIDAASDQIDSSRSLPFLLQIQEILHQDQPITFLWESQRLLGLNRRIRDARPNSLSLFANLEEWHIEPVP